MLNNPQDVAKGVTLTDFVTDAIRIEKGDISFGAINPKTNIMYLGYKNLNSLFAIDIKTKKIVGKIPLFRPKYIQVNPETNMIYVITNGSVAVIDGSTFKKVKDIDELPSLARFLALNSAKNLLYVTYNNGSDKSSKKNPIDRLMVFDCATHSKVKEISQGIREPEGVAMDSQSNLIYIANSKLSTISVFDGNTNSVIAQIEIPKDKLSWLGSGYQRLDNIVMINGKTKYLYVVGRIGSSGDGGGAEQACLYVLSATEKKLLHKQTLDGSPTEVCPSVVIDPNSEMVYIRKPSKNAILLMDGFAKSTVASIELTKMGFFKKIFSEKADPLIFNPTTRKVYQADGRLGILFEIDG